MTLNKKQLLFGFTFGFLGHSLYNSISNNSEKFKCMRKDTIKQFTNTNNFSEEFAKDDDIIDSFKELKKQASLLENKLNNIKK